MNTQQTHELNMSKLTKGVNNLSSLVDELEAYLKQYNIDEVTINTVADLQDAVDVLIDFANTSPDEIQSHYLYVVVHPFTQADSLEDLRKVTTHVDLPDVTDNNEGFLMQHESMFILKRLLMGNWEKQTCGKFDMSKTIDIATLEFIKARWGISSV